MYAQDRILIRLPPVSFSDFQQDNQLVLPTLTAFSKIDA